MNDPAVYRAYDAHERLLYVGMSAFLASRMREHKRSKSWWQDVARVTASFYDDRRDAYRAETRAIRAEAPLYNVISNA